MNERGKMNNKNKMKVFILAAGLGTRLRPYTDTMPKPMVPLNNVPLIGHIFNRLGEVGCTDIVVNLHHKADILRNYFKTRDDVVVTESFEDELLETGGGAKKALPLLGDSPFLMINGDAFWSDSKDAHLLQDLINAYDETKTDILLLLYPIDKMILTEGVGDYDVTGQLVPKRNADKTGKYMFAGVRICHPRIFKDTPDGKFGFLQLMDKAEKEGRLSAHIYHGDWHHISTPEDLQRVERELTKDNAA